MKYNESYQNAARAQNKVVKEAATLSARSLTELTNKRKCHELNSSRPHATNSQKLGTHYPELRETGFVARNVLVRRQWFHHRCQWWWCSAHVHCEIRQIWIHWRQNRGGHTLQSSNKNTKSIWITEVGARTSSSAHYAAAHEHPRDTCCCGTWEPERALSESASWGHKRAGRISFDKVNIWYLLVVQLDTTKKDVMEALQSGQLKAIRTLLLILSPAMEVTCGAAKITIFKLFLHCSGIS